MCGKKEKQQDKSALKSVSRLFAQVCVWLGLAEVVCTDKASRRTEEAWSCSRANKSLTVRLCSSSVKLYHVSVSQDPDSQTVSLFTLNASRVSADPNCLLSFVAAAIKGYGLELYQTVPCFHSCCMVWHIAWIIKTVRTRPETPCDNTLLMCSVYSPSQWHTLKVSRLRVENNPDQVTWKYINGLILHFMQHLWTLWDPH